VQYAYSEMAFSANHSRPTAMTYPNGRVLTDSYGSGLNNTISRLDALTESSGSVTLEGYSYLGLGTVAKRSHANGVALNYTTSSSSNDAGDTVGGLDRFGRILVQDWQLTSGTVTSSVDRFDYTYDRNGNRTTKNNWVANNVYSLGDDFDETYTYDGLNQISTMARGDGFDQSWTYDGLGNWTAFDDDGTVQTRSHNAQNEITAISGATTPAYDANGNMTTDETNKDFVYDAWNRLVEVKNTSNVTIQTYRYDALTRRVSESDGSDTKHLYYTKDWQVIEERLNSNAYADVQYVWSPVYIDAMVLRDRDSDHDGSHTLDERLWSTTDANYNVAALADAGGAAVERFNYTPFGLTTVQDGDFTVDTGGSDYEWVYRHQSGRCSLATGTMSFRDRDYSPMLGKWLALDIFGVLDNANAYSYLLNNPVVYTDPYGTKPQGHHPIPKGEDKFIKHPLVAGCKASLDKGQPLLPLEGHAGPHTDAYIKEVQDRLDAAMTKLPVPKTQEDYCKRLKEVVDGLMSDILAGKIDPYMKPKDNPDSTGKCYPTDKGDGKPYKPKDDYPLTPPKDKDDPLGKLYPKDPKIKLPDRIKGAPTKPK
jgi:RHS repeat-associated protein